MRIGRLVLLALFAIGCASQEPILLEEGGSRINELMLNVRMSPGDPESRVQLGMAYAEEDQLRMAVAWFDSALSIRPEYPHALFEKGRTLCRSGLEREGKKLINQAVRQPGGDQNAARLGRELGRPYRIRQLTSGTADNAFPSWFPSGRKLAFQSNRGANWDIYTLDPTTGSTERLTFDFARDEGPVVSGDGQYLAFTSTRNTRPAKKLSQMPREIYVRDLPNGDLRQVTFTHSDDYHVTFLPDGTKLYHVSCSPDGEGRRRIFELDIRSGQSRPITEELVDSFSPAVTSDGSLLLYVVQDKGTYTLREMNVTSRESKTITELTEPISDPDYSPDGKKIVFAAKRDGAHNIYLIDQDGTNFQRLTNDAAIDGHPRFSSDGSKIVFHSNRSGDFQLYEIDLTQSATLEDLSDYFDK